MKTYNTNADLPERIRTTHSEAEQDIYRLAFNNVLAATGDVVEAEEVARRTVEMYRTGSMGGAGLS